MAASVGGVRFDAQLLHEFKTLSRNVDKAVHSEDFDRVEEFALKYIDLLKSAMPSAPKLIGQFHVDFVSSLRKHFPKKPTKVLKCLNDSLKECNATISSLQELTEPDGREHEGSSTLLSRVPDLYTAKKGRATAKKKTTKLDHEISMVKGYLKKVFVIHGRNNKARMAMFTFLRAIGLEPIEWEEAVKQTGKGAPFVGEVLDAAFSLAQAIIVLATGDDLARLGTRFTGKGEKHEVLTPQARPNVVFEAGFALGRNPNRTILVELGNTRHISDLAGRHLIRIGTDQRWRQQLISRLQSAGCEVKTDARTDWLEAGDFKAANRQPDK